MGKRDEIGSTRGKGAGMGTTLVGMGKRHGNGMGTGPEEHTRASLLWTRGGSMKFWKSSVRVRAHFI